MTDHVKEIVQQIVAAAGDPLATLESVGGRIGYLYQQAEAAGDATSMQVISYAWTEIQQMNEQTTTAAGLAAAAKKVAVEITEQRDAVVKQHTNLVADINHINTDNELIAGLVEEVEQNHEEMLMYNGTYVSNCPGCDITEMAGIPVEHNVALRFFQMLVGEYELTKDQQEALGEIIVQFVERIKAEDKEAFDACAPSGAVWNNDDDPDEAA